MRGRAALVGGATGGLHRPERAHTAAQRPTRPPLQEPPPPSPPRAAAMASSMARGASSTMASAGARRLTLRRSRVRPAVAARSSRAAAPRARRAAARATDDAAETKAKEGDFGDADAQQLLGFRQTEATEELPKWKVMVQLTKPGTWIPVVWGVLCGAAASGNFHWIEGFPRDIFQAVLCMTLSGPCLTGFTQTINDWYDKDIDAINEPNRPIPSGKVTGVDVAIQSFGLMTAGWALAWQLDTWRGHEFPTLTAIALFGTFISYIYSAPPLKLKANGWQGTYALGASYIALPWWAGMAVFDDSTLTPEIIVITLMYSIAGLGIAIVNDFKVRGAIRRHRRARLRAPARARSDTRPPLPCAGPSRSRAIASWASSLSQSSSASTRPSGSPWARSMAFRSWLRSGCTSSSTRTPTPSRSPCSSSHRSSRRCAFSFRIPWKTYVEARALNSCHRRARARARSQLARAPPGASSACTVLTASGRAATPARANTGCQVSGKRAAVPRLRHPHHCARRWAHQRRGFRRQPAQLKGQPVIDRRHKLAHTRELAHIAPSLYPREWLSTEIQIRPDIRTHCWRAPASTRPDEHPDRRVILPTRLSVGRYQSVVDQACLEGCERCALRRALGQLLPTR